MGQTVSREILEAAEKAESKGKEAAARKEFEKADDYFKFAATKYRNISEGLKDETKKSKLAGRADKLDALAKQCRMAAKKSASQRIEPDVAEELAENPATESAPPESSVDIPEDSEDGELQLEEPSATVAAPPPVPAPPPAKAGAKIPKTKRLRRAKLPGKKTNQIVPAPKPMKVEAPKPAVAEQSEEESAYDPSDATVEEAPPVEPDFVHDPSDDTLDDIPDGHEPLPVSPVLTSKTVSSSGRASKVVSESDLNELANEPRQTASVVINLDGGDFPKEALKPGEFSIELSPRFTEHLCKALVMGDLEQIAGKFNKLADNLIRKAMGGDPRDELDLRYTALACREVADRLTDQPAASPVKEIEQARKAYRRGDHIGAATQYKQAAMRLLGRESEDPPEKLSQHERQASEFLNFSSRLRHVSEQG